MGLLIGLFMFSKLFSGTVQDDKYAVGQIWEYQTREGEEKSTLTIVNVEKNKKNGTIINVFVGGLKVKNPNADNGLSDEITHLPFSKEAVEKSVTRLIGTTKKLPDYKEGYDEWRTAFNNEEAGIFIITVKEAIEVMEITLNQ
jgi:hypothetical protein